MKWELFGASSGLMWGTIWRVKPGLGRLEKVGLHISVYRDHRHTYMPCHQ